MTWWAIGEPGQLVAQYDSSEPIAMEPDRVAIEVEAPARVGTMRIADDGLSLIEIAAVAPPPDRWWA